MKTKAVFYSETSANNHIKKQVVDSATGEILATEWVAPEGLFVDGRNATVRTVVIGREEYEDGTLIYVTDYDQPSPKLLLKCWRSGKGKGEPAKQGHTGNKPSYFKFYNEYLTGLASKVDIGTLGFFTLLGTLVDWDNGLLVDGRTKEAITQKGICKALNVSAATVKRKLSILISVGVVKKDSHGYWIDRQYIAKG